MAKLERTGSSESDVKDQLRRRLLPNISVRDLVDEITDVLEAAGRRPGTKEKLAIALANKLISKFAGPNRDLVRLIDIRPKQLDALLSEVIREEIQQLINANPDIFKLNKTRAKITTSEERKRRIKAAKNRYELSRSTYLGHGLIEREFSSEPLTLLPGFLPELPSGGPCLDEIFRGGATRMCDEMYSLQSLFGQSRKKLLAARPGIRRGREVVYDFRAVLRCMQALLKRAGENAPWLRDASLRQLVLSRILFRAREVATPEIAAAFEKTLLRYLN